MKKKVISILLAAALVCSSLFILSGCGDQNYPVSVANFEVKEEPKNIVVLDAPTADIISYIGYDVKMVGRSDEVDQQIVQIAPSVGSAASPDIQKIKETGADIVFAGDNLDAAIKEQLEEDGIKVITMSVADTPKQVETNYLTLGKILGGKVTGANKGTEAYSKLIDTMENLKSKVMVANNSNALETVCYLYFENNRLKLVTSGTYGDMLLGYTGAVNVAVNIDENKVDVNTLRVANPNYIFYSDEETLEAIKSDSVLSKLNAVRGGKTLQITRNEMTRQGYTAIETLEKMVYFIHPELNKSKDVPDESSPTAATSAPAATQAATANQNNTNAVPQTTTAAQANGGQTATQAPSQASDSVAEEYKINLTNLELKYEQDNDNVKIMQKRLYDLGYVTDEENITGYYGDISKKAVQDFQKNNKLKETGVADNATLVAMFKNDAVKAK